MLSAALSLEEIQFDMVSEEEMWGGKIGHELQLARV